MAGNASGCGATQPVVDPVRPVRENKGVDITVLRDITFLAAGPESERSRSLATNWLHASRSWLTARVQSGHRIPATTQHAVEVKSCIQEIWKSIFTSSIISRTDPVIQHLLRFVRFFQLWNFRTKQDGPRHPVVETRFVRFFQLWNFLTKHDGLRHPAPATRTPRKIHRRHNFQHRLRAVRDSSTVTTKTPAFSCRNLLHHSSP